MNFALFLEMHARGAPAALALVDRRLRLSFAQFSAAVDRCARLLRRSGLDRGDRLAIFLPNRAEVAIALLGAMKAGVIAVPLNWRLQGPELQRQVDHCAPAMMITTEERAARFATRDALTLLTVGEAPGTGTFWSEVDADSAALSTVACQSGDVANLLYTSGTTSTPKAAVHTHGMRVSIAAAMADCFALSSRDVGLAISPLFHTSGMSVFANCIFAGCPLILLERWDLDEFLATIERERVTFMHLIGTIVVDIAQAPEERFTRDTSSVRFTWGGGHSIDPQTFVTFERRIGGVFLQGYSRTEGGLAYNPLDVSRRRFDAHGYPNRNSSELAIFDPATRTRCADGTTGEIVVRGDGVSPGYWNHDGVLAPTLYAGNWQATGDSGYLDPQGALHFLGRRDHMIKTGGENVYPAEVETVLLATRGIADAVVLGMPDTRLGQRVAALVVRADAALTMADVEGACRRALAPFKVPRTIGFVGALPRLGNMKVDVTACQQLVAAVGARIESDRTPVAPQQPAAQPLFKEER